MHKGKGPMSNRTSHKERTNSEPRQLVRSVRITITTTPQVADYLYSLISLGLYGSSVAEVAERLICEALRNDLKRSRTALLEDKQ